MSVLSALEILRGIRAHPHSLPLMIMTSTGIEAGRIGSYRYGADSIVFPPVDCESSREAVRRLGSSWPGLNESPHCL